MTRCREGNLDGMLQFIAGNNSIGDDKENGLYSFVTMPIDEAETVFRINYKLASVNVLDPPNQLSVLH